MQSPPPAALWGKSVAEVSTGGKHFLRNLGRKNILPGSEDQTFHELNLARVVEIVSRSATDQEFPCIFAASRIGLPLILRDKSHRFPQLAVHLVQKP